ncbi:Hypothetical protein PACV_456 [Pacmanvirus A23]|uniref:Hypothetical protein n=1 Tax=Pacmanvirus A23 TaxID=1932881 RepID=UPI000A094587|nr:Hypothetical protein B9W72_gp452 [Pacmanvirus A23]SIP86169.1 Hypothetical protein PACV_456 [Pacmanvirus A23]
MNLPAEIWCIILDNLDYKSMVNFGESEIKNYNFICGYVKQYRKNDIMRLNGIYPHNRYSSGRVFLKQLSRVFDLSGELQNIDDTDDLFKQIIIQAAKSSKIIIKDNKFVDRYFASLTDS